MIRLTKNRYTLIILDNATKKAGITMDRKKDLRQQFEKIPVEAGIYQVKNLQNQKIFIGKTPNLKTLNGMKHILNLGANNNKALQSEWKQFGPDAFSFTVLELSEKKQGDASFNEKKELERLEKKWLTALQPYGERGYNRPKA
jgi:hypothetical protein